MNTSGGHDVAVLGAGLQGALCALELADRGCTVVIYDQQNDAITEASLNNEGKVHLGYIYSNDDLSRTAQLMARSAACFTPVLGRWMSETRLIETASSAFNYLVMHESLLTADSLAQKYQGIDALVAEALDQTGMSYFGETALAPTVRLPDDEWRALYSDAFVAAAFLTPERSVHLPVMADGIRKALADHPRVECRWGTIVSAVSRDPASGYSVHFEAAPKDHGFQHVVNALWGNRLAIDATLGLHANRPFLLRRKVANYITCADLNDILQSTTMVLGPFGDIVGYPDGRHYLSWYPTGCIDRSEEVELPQNWSHPLEPAEAERVFNLSIEQLDRRMPGVRAVVQTAPDATCNPGVIFTWGNTDVDDPDSELHQRFDVGPRTHWDTYHSVDTGKLSLAPYFALMTADRIVPK